MSWIPMDVLWGVNETAYGDFGYSLSIESGQLVVGAPGANGSSGEVTVFQEATVPFCGQCWSSTQVMSLANPVPDDGFGRVVDFAGPGCERFAAFAPGRNTGSGGEVFIYEFDLLGNSDWDLLQTTVLTGGPPFIVGTGGMAIDCDSMAFGIEGVFVSVHHRDMSNDYTNQFLILPETGSSLFGASIDISGDRLVVGDPAGDGFLGAVYYYHRVPGSDTWELVTRFVPPASSDQIRFGQSVHIADSILLIGAPPEGQSLSGAVYFIDLDSHTPNPSNVPALTTVGLLVLLIALIGPVASSRFRNQPQG
jgi:hypothetical protein